MFVEKHLGSQNETQQKYSPHVGFIGSHELRVPNYLFSSKSNETGYPHCRDIVDLILSRPIEEQFRKSKALTDFLRKREMTFAKLTKNGTYKIFSVPCTNTPLPLAKSMFDALERSAQVLVASLRLVLQDLYGSPSVRDASFVMSLPPDVRRIFINAVESAAHYFPQLHHPVMRQYPFFDVVGLDLVLTEDYQDMASRGPRLVLRGQNDLPFRLLEINAGSPSGASNNLHVLEGLSKIDPEMLQKAGRVMPNDHFQVLGETYRSIGEAWTGRKDGVQIVLPPGGQNGATPEIHQLAAYSGLIYADSGQLYRDPEGFVRLRTVSGKDPAVTAIYSRVNSDSALFDLERNLTLRDAESGKPLYLTDPLAFCTSRNPKPLRNAAGEKIPLESNYAIPSAIDAIHSRKLYLGGLNRVLDNKIILATLCYYAPQFFRTELRAMGINVDETLPVSPPETLPSNAEAVEIISKNPDDWVIKSPNLSGGKGVYIMQTLCPKEKREVLEKAKANPKGFAYQRLVRIARLPVAAKGRDSHYRYSNLAADLRMWSFYGSNGLPRLTHNGLIRVAPQEKGPLSSIVNTSMGGGYAPLLIIDDIGHRDSVAVEQLTASRPTAPLASDIPAFVGAQLVQIAHIVNELRKHLKRGDAEAFQTHLACLSLRQQCRELLSFIHPRSMESVNEMIETLEDRVPAKKIGQYFEKRNRARAALVSLIHENEHRLSKSFFDCLEEIKAMEADALLNRYTAEEQKRDRSAILELRKALAASGIKNTEMAKFTRLLRQLTDVVFPSRKIAGTQGQALLFQLELFVMLVRDHLTHLPNGKHFADLFAHLDSAHELVFDAIFAEDSRRSGRFIPEKPAAIASQEELRTGQLLVDSDFVSPELRAARQDWLSLMDDASRMPVGRRAAFLERARAGHFEKHPVLRQYQALLDSKDRSSSASIVQLLDIMPYAKYNFLQYAKQQRVLPQDVFTSSLADRRIALLPREERSKNGLSTDSFAGECFARKRQVHGLFSDSQIFLWIAPELHPFVQAYTIGHELVHFQQIRAMMELEQAALEDGPMAFAQFLNFFGNFLGLASNTIEAVSADVVLDRKPLYGFNESIYLARSNNWIGELLKALKSGKDAWNRCVARYGSTLGFSTDVSVQVKVKAIREVIPALENAKNIRFAKELGLRIELDEIQSALPTANAEQIERYREVIEQAIATPTLAWEALRLIASHQYPGVRFARRMREEETLSLQAPLFALELGGSYNQTQQ